MAKNYMQDVARMLGVELGEEFKLDGRETKYKFTENGIIKLPWQPKEGDIYYYPSGDFRHSQKLTWCNHPMDFGLKEAGMIFRTAEECEAALPELRKKYLGGDDNV